MASFRVCGLFFANIIYFHFHKFLMLFSLSEWSAICQADTLRSVDSLIQVSAWSVLVEWHPYVVTAWCVSGVLTLHAKAHTSRSMPNFAEVLAFLTVGLVVTVEQVVGVLLVLCLYLSAAQQGLVQCKAYLRTWRT
jgi:hypothetical protein